MPNTCTKMNKTKAAVLLSLMAVSNAGNQGGENGWSPHSIANRSPPSAVP
ncbi:hypothetical protein BIW11_03514 [Tropilaelaps mercedesae]|uniref:Uncharacterized protein n=1 Tax=Tropilaelaps mercedesae TaxID=418985 RepID=A0A1V9XJQ1_9ACAR|nr:hypothetical protein BIW11_03514 [Tropilaelaps mercedesae]